MLLERDATTPGPAAADQAASLVFLDPPYRLGLAPLALAALAENGWIAPGAVCVAEVEREASAAPPSGFAPLDERLYGGTKILFLRYGG